MNSTHSGRRGIVGCLLARDIMRLDRGRWTIEPPVIIGSNGRGTWESESRLPLTGTEGSASYVTTECADLAQNFKTVRVHWKNPYIGRSEYDANGTDPSLRVTWVEDGAKHAHVVFTVNGSR
jgi:hypothetical protein